MSEKITSYDQLPLILNAEDVAKILGISKSAVYGLFHMSGFPTLRVGKRMLVPRDKFIAWLDNYPGN